MVVAVNNKYQRIGVVSIDRSIDIPARLSFNKLYEAIGKNSGNLMFTGAMFSLLEGKAKKIGFNFDPMQVNSAFDIVVVPAANWLSATADWDWMLQRFEKVTIPVVVMGLGLQASSSNLDEVEVSDSALRLAQFFADRAPQISVRGEFTRKWLELKGITNVVTTGCPSLYMNVFKTTEATTSDRVIFQSTRYAVSRNFVAYKGINRRMFSLSARFEMPMVYQSEPEEIELLVSKKPVSTLPPETAQTLAAAYDLDSPADLEKFLRKNGEVFFDLSKWSTFVRAHMGVIGTRLHGSIIALNSGRNALLIPHDSRTEEVGSFAAIPRAFGPDIMKIDSLDGIRDVIRNANLEMYKDRRSENQVKFLKFLRECGLQANPRNMF